MKNAVRLWLRSAALLTLAAAVSSAGAQTVTVSAANVQDGGSPANGTIYFAPVLAAGQAASYNVPGGGIASVTPVHATVTNGAFSLAMPDTSATNPVNICFKATLNTANGSVLGPGFNCVQPAGSNSWCSASVCNFDHFVPNLAPLTVVTAGPAGPACSTGSGTCVMTVPIQLPADPSAALDAATKQYADTKLPQAGGTLTGPLTGTSASFTSFANSGAYTQTGTAANTLTGPLTAISINKVVSACSYAGATADVQIAAAIADLPNGGTVDTRCYGATTQTLAAPVTIGDGLHSYSLICDGATTYIPATAAEVMVNVKSGARIFGCSFDTTGMVFTGSVLQLGTLTKASDPGPVTQGPDTYGHYLQTIIDGVHVNGNLADTSGHGIDILASNGFDSFASWIKIQNAYVYGLTCLNLQTAGTGYVNSNQISNLTCESKTGIFAQPNGGVIAANQFSNFGYEGDDAVGVDGILASGTGFFNGNIFSSSVFWDYENGKAIDLSASANFQNNYFGASLNNGLGYSFNGTGACNVVVDPRSSTFYNPCGTATPWIASTIVGDGGVSGQGGILGRDGGTGGGTLGPVGSITGTSRAISLLDGGGTPRVYVEGNGVDYINGLLVDTAGNVTGLAGINGVPAPTAALQFSNPWSGSAGTVFAANQTVLYSLNIPLGMTVDHIRFRVLTADNTANLYDVGIYSVSGSTATLMGHLGATAGTTFAPGVAIKLFPMAAPFTIGAGTYLFAMTTNCTASCAVLAGSALGNFSLYVSSAGGATTGGVLNASLTGLSTASNNDSSAWTGFDLY